MILPRVAMASGVLLALSSVGIWNVLPQREVLRGAAPLCLRETGEGGTRSWEKQPCCDGLRPLKKSVRTVNGWGCSVPENDEKRYVCTRCGDGICGRAENSCNCPHDCPIPWACGNKKLQDHEQCDDGNRRIGDGCSERCTTEEGWICAGSPSICRLRRTPVKKRTASGSDITSCLGKEDGSVIRLGDGCTVCTCGRNLPQVCTRLPCS